MLKLNGKLLLILLSVLLVSLSGCDSDPARAKQFDGREYTLFTNDSTGEKWMIKHNFGDNYILKRCKDMLGSATICEDQKAN